jgi:hypothetical protein
LDIPLLVPELCVRELVQQRRNEARDAIRKANSLVSHVARYLDNPPTLGWGKDEEQILADVEARVHKYLSDNGLRVIPTPSILLDTLTDMAVRKIRPFEERGEKGFRDSVILFTILEYAKTPPPGYHLLLSRDSVFEHEDVKARTGEAGIDLRVANSVADAFDHLKQFVTDTVKEWAEEKSQALRAFLLEHMGEIEGYVREKGEFTSGYLLSDDTFASLTTRIQAIESVELTNIVNAQPGKLPNDAVEGKVQVSFGAEVKFTLAVSILPPLTGPTFRVRREGESVEATRSDNLLAAFMFNTSVQDEQQSRREVTKVVNVVGTAHLREPSEYSDLELSDVGGSTFVETLMGAAFRAR